MSGRWWLLPSALSLLVTAAVAGPVAAHDAATWIMENPRFVDRDNVHCCGPTDCRRDMATKFREAPEGVWVTTGAGDEILVPRALVGRGLYPSIDDWWWICIRAGVVRCVFKPTTGM